MLTTRVIALAALWTCPAVALTAGADKQETPRVAILFGTPRSCREAAASLEEALTAKGYECILIELPGSKDKPGREATRNRLVETEPAIVATAGTTATSFALEAIPDVPVVFFMVPNARDAPFVKEGSPHPRRVAGVTTDVSPEQRIDWIARVHPEGSRLAVLHSPRTAETAQALKAAARRSKITVIPIEADRNEFPAAIEALDAHGCDGVLMIPDARVYNTATIKRLLLWGIRQKKAVWAFSAAVVKAGALGGQYSDSHAIGRQAAELVQKIIAGTPSAEPGTQYPRQVGRAVNERTAEMISVVLDDSAVGTDAAHFGEQP